MSRGTLPSPSLPTWNFSQRQKHNNHRNPTVSLYFVITSFSLSCWNCWKTFFVFVFPLFTCNQVKFNIYCLSITHIYFRQPPSVLFLDYNVIGKLCIPESWRIKEPEYYELLANIRLHGAWLLMWRRGVSQSCPNGEGGSISRSYCDTRPSRPLMSSQQQAAGAERTWGLFKEETWCVRMGVSIHSQRRLLKMREIEK